MIAPEVPTRVRTLGRERRCQGEHQNGGSDATIQWALGQGGRVSGGRLPELCERGYVGMGGRRVVSAGALV
jgi:hypothetical protein